MPFHAGGRACVLSIASGGALVEGRMGLPASSDGWVDADLPSWSGLRDAIEDDDEFCGGACLLCRRWVGADQKSWTQVEQKRKNERR